MRLKLARTAEQPQQELARRYQKARAGRPRIPLNVFGERHSVPGTLLRLPNAMTAVTGKPECIGGVRQEIRRKPAGDARLARLSEHRTQCRRDDRSRVNIASRRSEQKKRAACAALF